MLTQRVQHHIRALTGADDPYADDPYCELKQRANEVVLAALPALSAEVRAAEDPLTAAVRLAIAGNTIDAGANGADSVKRIEQELSVACERPFHGDVDEFRRAVGSARSILFLTDNTGEIVIDRLLGEQPPLERTTFAVRGAQVLIDATLADAGFAGLDRLAEVIDNGSDAPGTMLADCSRELRLRFAAADLIIAKGQGDYETLSGEPHDIFFLFAVKCDVAERHAGLPRGTQVLLRSAVENVAIA
ncbi:MAG: ARMT1-like domain-containing protein [Actinomycetes bacterium]